MKKIKINYDLIEKINESKNGIILHKIIKSKALSVATTFGILSPMYIMTPAELNFTSILTVFSVNATFGGLEYYIQKKFKEKTEIKASLELIKFIIDLHDLDVKTTFELLGNAEIIKTNYKINYKINYKDSNKLPVLKQEKYIEIPLSNGYKETLLQEHNIGSKEYEISVNEPVKKMKYKLSRALQ